MTKHLLLLITLLLTVTLGLSAQNKSGSSALTKENANKIIAMTNCVVDIYNNQIGEIKDLRNCLEEFDNSINEIAENPNTPISGVYCSNIRSLRSDLVDKLKRNAGLAPSFAEKQAILDGITQLNNEFEISNERSKALKAYFSSKKYIEDDNDYSGYEVLYDNLIASYKNIINQFDKTRGLASEAGDRAELVILKNHPLALVVIPMKSNLSAISQLMSKCREDEPNVEEIKVGVAMVRESLEKDNAMTPAQKTALVKRQNGEVTFERFYEYAGGALDNIDIFIEFLDPNKEVSVDHVLQETEEDARNRHLRNHYNDIQKYYRSMIDVYNTL